MKVRNKVVVVTGGGNGIGRQVVLELLRREARVAAVDIRQGSLDETAQLANAGDRLATFVTDITDQSAVEALPRKVIDALGVVDGVINVAGIIQPFVPLKDLEYEAIERVVNVNSSPISWRDRSPTSPTFPAWAGSSPCRGRPSTGQRRRR